MICRRFTGQKHGHQGSDNQNDDDARLPVAAAASSTAVDKRRADPLYARALRAFLVSRARLVRLTENNSKLVWFKQGLKGAVSKFGRAFNSRSDIISMSSAD